MASRNEMIVRDPDVLGGTPVFRGTRVPFQTLLEYLEAGQTLDEFLDVMRTGHDPDAHPRVLLQVMPWPLYRWKTDRDLTAIYEYLRAIPSLSDNPDPGP